MIIINVKKYMNVWLKKERKKSCLATKDIIHTYMYIKCLWSQCNSRKKERKKSCVATKDIIHIYMYK